jgi:hypothetical protein
MECSYLYVPQPHTLESSIANVRRRPVKAGLFSAILTAFIIESYKTLQPDHSMALVCIAQQIANATGSIPAISTFPCEKLAKAVESPAPDTSSLVCNILWFISLGLSLASALTATLVEEWAREFLQR